MSQVAGGKPLPEADAVAWSSVCLNCRSPLSGPFCSDCGQRAVPPHPTIRELAGDTYGELVGWDGKFAATVRLLLTRPGELTRILLEGRRVQFVSPVRLYLLCSLVYFLVAAAAPPPDTEMELDVGIGFGSGDTEQSAGEAAMAKAISNGLASLTPAERSALDLEIAALPSIFQPIVRAMAEDYRSLSRRVVETMPRALFVLIPALALILAVFYRGRPYPDHLYFAIHFQAFVFLLLPASALAQFSRSLVVIAIAQGVTVLWIVAYAIVAQRRVYGGSWLATGLKAIGVASLYGSLWSLATIVVTLWATRGN